MPGDPKPDTQALGKYAPPFADFSDFQPWRHDQGCKALFFKGTVVPTGEPPFCIETHHIVANDPRLMDCPGIWAYPLDDSPQTVPGSFLEHLWGIPLHCNKCHASPYPNGR